MTALRSVWRTLVTAGMFLTRLALLGLMILLQLTIGGAEIRPRPKQAHGQPAR